MPSKNYRIYSLDGSGSINLADWIDATSDEDAIAKARQVKHGRAMAEIWQANRLVAKLEAQDLSG